MTTQIAATDRQIQFLNDLLKGCEISSEGEAYLYRKLESMKSESDPKLARVHELSALEWVCGQMGLMADRGFMYTEQDLVQMLRKRERRLEGIRQAVAEDISKAQAAKLIDALKQNSIPFFRNPK